MITTVIFRKHASVTPRGPRTLKKITAWNLGHLCWWQLWHRMTGPASLHSNLKSLQKRTPTKIHAKKEKCIRQGELLKRVCPSNENGRSKFFPAGKGRRNKVKGETVHIELDKLPNVINNRLEGFQLRFERARYKTIERIIKVWLGLKNTTEITLKKDNKVD